MLNEKPTLNRLVLPPHSRYNRELNPPSHCIQLEQTVTKLQYALSLSPDQVAVLPPPIVRIRELEEQNKELVRQIDELRTQLEDRNTRVRTTTVHRSHSGPVLPTFDDRGSDHDTVKRRRTVEGSDDLLVRHRHWNTFIRLFSLLSP